MQRILLSGLMILTLSGCLPVIWATPPTKLETGVGASRVSREDGNGAYPQGHFDVRGSLSPLQFFPELGERRADVGLGYGARFHFFDSPLILHGPYLKGYALMYPARRGRLGVGMQMHALLSNRNEYTLEGGRAAFRVFYEWSDFAEGPFDTCSSDFCGTGYAYGEGSFGFYAEVSNTLLATRWEQGVTAGILIRLPGTVGAGIAIIDISNLL